MLKRFCAVTATFSSAAASSRRSHLRRRFPGEADGHQAGRLIDPETGTAAINQVILIEGRRSRRWDPP